MKNLAIACTGLLASGMAMADNLEGTDDLLCAAGHVQLCFRKWGMFPRSTVGALDAGFCCH